MKKINLLAIAAFLVAAFGLSGCVETPGGYYGGSYPGYGPGYGYPVYGSAYGYPAYEGWGSPAWNYGFGRTWGWPYHHDWDHYQWGHGHEGWALGGNPHSFGERRFRPGAYAIARNHEFGRARFGGDREGHFAGRSFEGHGGWHRHERH